MILAAITIGPSQVPARYESRLFASKGWSFGPILDLQSGNVSLQEFALQSLVRKLHGASNRSVSRWSSVEEYRRELVDRIMLLSGGERYQGEDFIEGEVLSYHLEGWRAFAKVRLTSFGCWTGFASGGAVGVAEGLWGNPEVSDEDRVREVVGRAFDSAWKAMEERKPVEAKVTNTYRNYASIDQGWRKGFRSGMDALVYRGGSLLAVTRVRNVSKNCAEFLYGRVYMSIAPGDSVRQTYSNKRLGSTSSK